MALLKAPVMALASAKCHVCGLPARGVRVWVKPAGIARATEHFDGSRPCIEDDGDATVITRPPEKDTVIVKPKAE